MKRATIVVVALAGCLLAACQTELYKGLTQREANEMLAVLLRHGLDARREQADATTYRITVEEHQLGQAVEILKRAGYPRETYRSLGEIFPGDGLVTSPYEQRVRMMFALNQEIARTITSIAGVVSARVHVVIPDLDLRGVPMNKPSSSVVVHHGPGVETSELATKIRLIVANAVQGLNFRDVSVALFAAGDGEGEPALRGTSSPVVQARGQNDGAQANILRDPPGNPADPSFFQNALSMLLWCVAGLMAVASASLALRGRLRRTA